MLQKRNIIYKETWGTANALVISTSNHDKGVTTDLDILQARNGHEFKSGSSNAQKSFNWTFEFISRYIAIYYMCVAFRYQQYNHY